jgi:hypothetical protein
MIESGAVANATATTKEDRLKSLYMKVGTWPGMYYYVKGNKPLAVNMRIQFKEMSSGAKWEGGLVVEIRDLGSHNMVLVDRM